MRAAERLLAVQKGLCSMYPLKTYGYHNSNVASLNPVTQTYAYSIFVRKSERSDHSDDLGLDRMIILEWILGK